MSILLLGAFDAADYATWHAHLAPYFGSDRLALAIDPHDPAAVEIALVANPPPGALARYPNLRFVQSLWAGVDRLLADDSLPTQIVLARLVDPALTTTMTECVLAHVLALHRQAPAYAQQQARAEWKPRPQPLAADRTIGVLGLGELGAAAAHALARVGFSVAGWSRTPREITSVRCHHGHEGLRAVIGAADILVNLLPLTSDTADILDASVFAAMPHGAALVNVGRGAHLVEADLLEALDRGRLRHAILDVFREEPLPRQHPFWSHPQITVLPHVAADTDPVSAARLAAANVGAFRAGRALVGVVDRTRGY